VAPSITEAGDATLDIRSRLPAEHLNRNCASKETSGKAQAVHEGYSAVLVPGSELRAQSNIGADVRPAEDMEMQLSIQASRTGTGYKHWALEVFTDMSETTLKPSQEKYVPNRLRDMFPL
jgi:hypothetical protein